MVRRSNRKRKKTEDLVFAGWKILKKSKEHYSHIYSIGLNKDKKKFDPSGGCKEGGLYFASTNVLDFISLYQFNDVGTIHRVYTYPDSQVYHEYNKSKTDKFWLDEGFDLSLESTWKMMVENGIDVDTYSQCCLLWASYQSNVQVIKFFIDSGTDITIVLERSSATGNLSMVKYLVENGANIHACCDYALRYSSKNGHLPVVKYLIEKGADVHAFCGEALLWAAESGHLSIVKHLIEKGADINSFCEALLYAAENGHLSVVEFLVEKGADIHNYYENGADDGNDLALPRASGNGHLSVVKFLVEKGVDFHTNNDFALRTASIRGHNEVVNYLKSLQ
jgi:ankyrin repeat protein